jgi:hemolysin III
MLSAVLATQPDYTRGEEFCNVVTHGLAFAFGLFKILTFKPNSDVQLDDSKAIATTGKRILLFSFTILFANSTIYHAMVNPFLKSICRFMDHFSVVVTMVGTTAPIIFHGFSPQMAFWIILALWGIILSYVYFAFYFWEIFEAWEVKLYLPFATLCSALTIPGFRRLHPKRVQMFMKGLMAYATGVPFFIKDDIRYTHSVFHCAILIGAWWHCRAVMDPLEEEELKS